MTFGTPTQSADYSLQLVVKVKPASFRIQGFAKWLLQMSFDSRLTFGLHPYYAYRHNKKQLASLYCVH